MPELPDITVYIERLTSMIVGQPLQELDVRNVFVLRSVAPAPADLAGRRVAEIRRMGKRIVIGFEGDLFVVIHLMIAGRLRWRAAGKKPPGRSRSPRSSSLTERFSSPRRAPRAGRRSSSSPARAGSPSSRAVDSRSSRARRRSLPNA